MTPLPLEHKSNRMHTDDISWEERARPEREDFLKERRPNVIPECDHNISLVILLICLTVTFVF